MFPHLQLFPQSLQGASRFLPEPCLQLRGGTLGLLGLFLLSGEGLPQARHLALKGTLKVQELVVFLLQRMAQRPHVLICRGQLLHKRALGQKAGTREVLEANWRDRRESWREGGLGTRPLASTRPYLCEHGLFLGCHPESLPMRLLLGLQLFLETFDVIAVLALRGLEVLGELFSHGLHFFSLLILGTCPPHGVIPAQQRS